MDIKNFIKVIKSKYVVPSIEKVGKISYGLDEKLFKGSNKGLNTLNEVVKEVKPKLVKQFVSYGFTSERAKQLASSPKLAKALRTGLPLSMIVQSPISIGMTKAEIDLIKKLFNKDGNN